MKKVKLFLVAALLLGGTFAAYTSYEQSTLTDAERLMKQNLEALTQDEINPDCPNGCLDKPGSCHCYGDHPYEEAVW